MKNIIKRFNTPDTFLIISDYPEMSKKGEKNYGIAWYTKELLVPLARNYNTKFIVLAEKGIDNEPKILEKGKILLLRVFDQKHPSLFPKILKWMQVFNKVKEIHVHSEFCTNGGIKNFMLVVPFFMLIKLTGKRITYFSHNVVTDLETIAPHLGMTKGSFKLKLYTKGLAYYYRLLGLLVDHFVVMDGVMQKRLETFVNPNKITLLPFWIEKPKVNITRKQARAKLAIRQNELVLVYFGFITYYKGADWIVKTIKELRKKKKFSSVRLILAGGQAYSLKDKAYYQTYYNNLLESIKAEANIQITGFVPEDMIATYFQAADLMVFPYRGLIGGSGSLTQAIAYNKPFIIGRGMDEILENEDVATACRLSNILSQDLCFNYTTASFEKVLTKLLDSKYRKQAANVSTELGVSRSKTNLLVSCYNELYAPKSVAQTTRFSLPTSAFAIGK